MFTRPMPPFSPAPPTWTPPPRTGLHLWAASLDLSSSALAHLRSLLSPEELARAATFHNATDQHHFIAAHGRLRQILAGYLDLQPSAVLIQTSPASKPHLAQNPTLQFNLAHSGSMAVYAIASHRPVGIDLESLRPVPEAAAILTRFFPRHLSAFVKILPPAQHARLFLHYWTRAEALAKGQGTGLDGPLPLHRPGWSVRSFRLPPSYLGACAVQGWPAQCSAWNWSPERDNIK